MNPELLPTFNILATGRDDVQIATVSDLDWASFVNTIVVNAEPGADEWYTMDIARLTYNMTGLGYFPQGVTIDNMIIVRDGAKGNITLLAHEYGHALGYSHTNPAEPDVMNPVDWMRKGDQHNLRSKFKENFPDYYKTFMTTSQNTLLIGAVAVGLGWFFVS